MTAKASEVIAALQRAIEEHGDLPILLEGCDCLGECEDATTSLIPDWMDGGGAPHPHILIERIAGGHA